MNVLVLNCGSSSAKFAVIDPVSSTEAVSGIAQRLGSPEASLDWKQNGTKTSRPTPGAHHDEALRGVVDLLRELGLLDSSASATVSSTGARSSPDPWRSRPR
jgi:acetate kinase